MKKSILIIGLVMVAMAVFAIDYPTYKPNSASYMGNVSVNNRVDKVIYGGYSTVATGGTTTYGEGSATNEQSRVGARRTALGDYDEDGFPIDPEDGDKFVKDGWEYEYDAYLHQWLKKSQISQGDEGTPQPIGDPTWPMLAFVLIAAGVICMRRIYSFGEKK